MTVDEGGSGTYTLALKTPPAGNVTITPASGDSGAVTVAPASLTFTTTNWNTARTVSVTGVKDDDGNAETVTVSHGVSGYGSVDSAADLTVTVADDDAPEVDVCERTPAVRDAIVDAIMGITACADVSMVHLSEMTGPLNLRFQDLDSLKETDFAGLSSLQQIDLGQNSLSSLPADIFAGLSSLKLLNLTGSPLLSSLPALYDPTSPEFAQEFDTICHLGAADSTI